MAIRSISKPRPQRLQIGAPRSVLSPAHLVFPPADGEVADGPGCFLLGAKVPLRRDQLSATLETPSIGHAPDLFQLC